MPTDPFMLLSYVNMKLRDQYSSLEAFCEAEDVDQSKLISDLAAAGFEYSAENNKFW